MDNLNDTLTRKLISKGASKVGFADLSVINVESRQGYARGISIAVALNPQIILGIADGPTIEYYAEYNRVNGLLDELAEYAAKMLGDSGFAAFPMTRRNVVEDESIWRTLLPHKTVATRAGMGWIGKCALLVIKEFGSAVRITSVLTNAEFETGIPYNEALCGNCTNCKDACPGKAISGISWTVNTDRDLFYNAFDCRKTARQRTAQIGIQASMCGLCMHVCPWTQRYLVK